MSSAYWGILYGLMAGAFWGLSFLIPKLFSALSPGDLALARCSGFAFIAALVLWKRRKTPLLWGMHRNRAVWLATIGYSAYFFLLIFSVRFAGISVSSLLIGLLPLTISLASRDRVQRPWMFRISLAMICAGIAVLNIDGLSAFQAGGQGSAALFLLGVVFALVCVLLWTLFAVQNGRFLKNHREIVGSDWAAVLGVHSLIMVLPLVFLEHALRGTNPVAWALTPELLSQFLFAVVVLGFGCSYIATLLWNIASQRLPTGILGQLIVSETVFALLYSFLSEHRLPTLLEAASIFLLVFGVILGIRSFLEKKLAKQAIE